MSIINKTQVLKLNSAWQAVGQSTVGKAIVDLAAGKSARALDMEYEKDENGKKVPNLGDLARQEINRGGSGSANSINPLNL